MLIMGKVGDWISWLSVNHEVKYAVYMLGCGSLRGLVQSEQGTGFNLQGCRRIQNTLFFVLPHLDTFSSPVLPCFSICPETRTLFYSKVGKESHC